MQHQDYTRQIGSIRPHNKPTICHYSQQKKNHQENMVKNRQFKCEDFVQNKIYRLIKKTNLKQR